MNPNNPETEPIIVSKYIPFLYKYEHPQAYQFREIASSGSYSAPTPDAFPVNPNQPQTVEQIIDNGYFTSPPGDPTTALISDKSHTAWLGLDDVIGQIKERLKLYKMNIDDLEEAKCNAMNAFFEHYDRVKPFPSDDRIYYSLNKNLDRLYRDQRDERVNLWRDISRLRQSLPENAQQYLSAFRKLSVLNDTQGEGL